MPVEFSIRTSDLRRAIEQLKVNRGKYNDSDSVDIVITDSAARFTAVGTESEELVEGKHLGSLRMPLKLVDTISEQLGTFKKSTVPFKCSPGVIKIESWTIRNEAIELNPKLERGTSLPIDLSMLDTLALSTLRTAKELARDGLGTRVQDARQTRDSAVQQAVKLLEPFAVSEKELLALVETHVADAAARLAKSVA